MTIPVLELPLQHWYCPACGRQATTRARPHQGSSVAVEFHPCPKLRGLRTPMLRQGVKGKVELREREDMVGDEMVALDPERGRPVQSIVTTRDNGQDVTVFAPTATLHGKSPN